MNFKVTLYSRTFSQVYGYGIEVVNDSVEVEASNAQEALTKVMGRCVFPGQVTYATIEETDYVFHEKDGQLFARWKETYESELEEEKKWADKPKTYEAAVEIAKGKLSPESKDTESSCPCMKEDDAIIFTEEEEEAFSALKKLRFLRKAWVGDWEVEVYGGGVEEFWGIDFDDDDDGCPVVNHYYTANSMLSFPTKEMAWKFLETFRDLVIKITPLFYC